MKPKLLTLLFRLAVLLLIATAGCNPQTVVPPPKDDITHVAVVKPQRKSMQYTVEVPGQIEGFEEAPLYAKLAAYVEKVNADIGSQVDKGDVLAILRIPELQREFEQKVAAVKQANAALGQAQAAVVVAQAAVTSAKAKLAETKSTVERTEADYRRWQSENARMAELADKGSVTRKVADETKNQFAAADAARKEAAALVDSAKALVAEAEARQLASVADEAGAAAKVQVAEADQAHVKALLSYTEIRAPFTGVVTRRNVHPGYFVQPAEESGGKPLFAVARTDLLRVTADVPETDAPFVAIGTRAEVRVPAMGHKGFSEPVKRTAIALDTATRTLRVEMDLKNDDHVWRPGLYVVVALSVERPDALVVPAAAIFIEGGQNYCVTVADGKVDRKAVETGVRNGGDVQITSGLSENDQIVAKDAARLRSGQMVELTALPANPPPAPEKK